MKVQFIKSEVNPIHFPEPKLPEVAVVGRSNAGKSSFLNTLLNQKIADVSSVPGRTRRLNFFNVENSMFLVDIPGYGFASGDLQEVVSWKKMTENYLRSRENLTGAVLVVDIRRDWEKEEETFRQLFCESGIPWILVLNKADKLSSTEVKNRRNLFQKNLPEATAYAVSALKKSGFKELKRVVLGAWARFETPLDQKAVD